MDRGSNLDVAVHNFCLHHQVYKRDRCIHILHIYCHPVILRHTAQAVDEVP